MWPCAVCDVLSWAALFSCSRRSLCLQRLGPAELLSYLGLKREGGGLRNRMQQVQGKPKAERVLPWSDLIFHSPEVVLSQNATLFLEEGLVLVILVGVLASDVLFF